jgi:hypothetical protein
MGKDTKAVTAHNLAANMPAHLALMNAMSWFGIPSSDRQGAGVDLSYGNWKTSVSCQDNAPNWPDPNAACSGQRAISSRFHPLAGVYSSSGLTAESCARIDLMLSTLRRSCTDAARVDGWIVQLNGTAFTSLHSGSPGATTEIAYQSLKHFQTEAAANGLTGTVIAGDDATYYWNNGHWFGLECSTNRAQCIADLQQDVMDMMDLSNNSTAALKIGGIPLLWFYVDTQSADPNASEWQTIFNNVRAAKGDFYALASASAQLRFDPG